MAVQCEGVLVRNLLHPCQVNKCLTAEQYPRYTQSVFVRDLFYVERVIGSRIRMSNKGGREVAFVAFSTSGGNRTHI